MSKEYCCINEECEHYDPNCYENCDSYGIRYDGHKCSNAIIEEITQYEPETNKIDSIDIDKILEEFYFCINHLQTINLLLDNLNDGKTNNSIYETIEHTNNIIRNARNLYDIVNNKLKSK